MKVEGIPAKVDINADHDHHVVIEVQLSRATADNIKDVAVTILTVMATTAIAKSIVGTANRILLEQQYHKIWGVKP